MAVLEPGVTWTTSLGGLAPFAGAVGLGLLLAGWGLRNGLLAAGD